MRGYGFRAGFLVWLGLLATVVVSGCRSYEGAPIDWDREADGWRAESGEVLELSLETARLYALVLNPEINAKRLEYQSSKREALASGWWEDPEFEVDGLRIIKGGAHPWIAGTGLRFTIPLSGVPGIERRAAEGYAEADRLAVLVVEQELVAEVEGLWFRCRLDFAQAELQHRYVAELEERAQGIARLIEAGELPRSEGERVAQEIIRLELECACSSAEAVERRQSLLKLIGVHPEAGVRVVDGGGDGAELLREGREVESALELVGHLRVQEQLVRFAASEEGLRGEIRRQYPDLEIGPLLEHEEGRARAGLGLGIRLPLWNRNRLGIAVAEGDRDQHRLAAVNEWRRAVMEWHSARELLQVASAKERRIREDQLPVALEAAERVERLFRQGEADVLAVLAADETLYSLRQKLLETEYEVRAAEIGVNRWRVGGGSGEL